MINRWVRERRSMVGSGGWVELIVVVGLRVMEMSRERLKSWMEVEFQVGSLPRSLFLDPARKV